MSKSSLSDQVGDSISEIDFGVFGAGVLLTGALILFLALKPELAGETILSANKFLVSSGAWYFQGLIFALVIFFLFVMLSSWGKTKLGDPDEDPEYSYLAYFAMVFAGTFGAGLVYWGPAEALFHYQTPPPLVDAPAQSTEAMVGAMQYSLFHWGISPWVGHMILSVPLAYYTHKKGLPLKPSAIFAPFIGGENLDSRWLKIVDIIAVISAAGGATVTVGMAGQQMITGLAYNYGIQLGDIGVILLITGITVGYTSSAILGIKKGIRRLSLINIVIFAFTLIYIFLISPIDFVMNLASQGLGQYILEFVPMSLFTGVTGGQDWVGAWTIFYWAWWISFAPMTGIFVARISKGRTLRQLIFTGMFAGSAAALPWFITLGGYAMSVQHFEGVPLLEVLSEHGSSVAAYPMLETLPLGELLIAIFLVMVIIFLITTIDSATISLAIFSTEEATHSPTPGTRLTWGALIGLLTSLLLVAGGIDILRNFTVIAGTPLAIFGLISVLGFAIQMEKENPLLLTEKGDWELTLQFAEDQTTPQTQTGEVSADD